MFNIRNFIFLDHLKSFLLNTLSLYWKESFHLKPTCIQNTSVEMPFSCFLVSIDAFYNVSLSALRDYHIAIFANEPRRIIIRISKVCTGNCIFITINIYYMCVICELDGQKIITNLMQSRFTYWFWWHIQRIQWSQSGIKFGKKSKLTTSVIHFI